eukprot:Pgem_evm1s1957
MPEARKIKLTDFETKTTYALFKPFNNFLFSIFQLAGIHTTVDYHEGLERKHQYLRLNNYLKQHIATSGIKDLQLGFDNSSNLNEETTGKALREFNGQCFRKLVLGDMGKLAESMVHGGITKPNDPRHFREGYIRNSEYINTQEQQEQPQEYKNSIHKNFESNSFYKPDVQTVLLSKIGITLDTTRPLAIIIDRGSKRALKNIKEISKMVSRYGFNVAVVPYSQLTIQEQIIVTRHSALIIGVHGAGLANLIWAKAGSAVLLEIFPYHFQKFTYQAIAYNIGLKHLWWENDRKDRASETKYSNAFEKGSWDYYRNLDTEADIESLELKVIEAVVYLKGQYPELKI